MKTKAIYYSVALMILFSYGCIDDNGICEKGRGDNVTEAIETSDFSGVSLRMDAQVYIEQGTKTEVLVNAQLNIIDELDIAVRNDVLVIDTDRCLTSHSKIEIYITMEDIREVNISGSGDVIGDSKFIVSDLDLRISGSGDMDLEVEANRISADVSGSGDMYLVGLTGELSYRVSGSGDLHSFGLISDRADILINGSGDAEVHVLDFLDVRISGSGDVFYKGDPMVESKVSGSGDVIYVN